MNATPQYDPYTYNPMLRAFYVNSNFTNRPTQPPAAVQIAARDNPGAAAHIYAVWGFLDWMRASNPELFNMISNQAPSLVDAPGVVLSGKLAADSKSPASGLAGLGNAVSTDDYGNPIAAGSGSAWDSGAVTEWGNRVFDLAGKYLQYDAQKQIIKLNIARAEKGLSPIDSSALAPTVNIGASPAVQQLGYLAIGGLVLAGVVAAFSKAKR